MTQTGSTKINSVPLLDVSRENGPLSDRIKSTISDIVDSGRFIGGPHCQAFEQSVADLCTTEFAIGCASGSDALLLALMAIGLQPGDEVICPSFTFFATASCVSRLGATPVFVDVDPITFNIDPEKVEEAVTSKTKAIIPVHLFGLCCDIDAIMSIAKRHDLRVIEDCAQSIGSSSQGRMSGSIGDVGCFSFYPTKNLGGMGDGGIITTNDPDLADQIRLLTNHGMRPRYYHQEIGINSRLDSIQAAVLNIKIENLADYSALRNANAQRYIDKLSQSAIADQITLPTFPAGNVHVWNQFTIRVTESRDWVREKLGERNVGSEVYYPVPVHQQECYQHLGYQEGDLPVTESLAGQVLSIPVFPGLTQAEQDYVIDSLVDVVSLISNQKVAA